MMGLSTLSLSLAIKGSKKAQTTPPSSERERKKNCSSSSFSLQGIFSWWWWQQKREREREREGWLSFPLLPPSSSQLAELPFSYKKVVFFRRFAFLFFFFRKKDTSSVFLGCKRWHLAFHLGRPALIIVQLVDVRTVRTRGKGKNMGKRSECTRKKKKIRVRKSCSAQRLEAQGGGGGGGSTPKDERRRFAAVIPKLPRPLPPLLSLPLHSPSFPPPPHTKKHFFFSLGNFFLGGWGKVL